METLEYRGVLDRAGNLAICSAWDHDGQLVRFAADVRMIDGIPAGALVEVPNDSIMSRRPAFEVVA